MPTITTGQLCRALWDCSASDVLPDNAHSIGLYLDPAGPCVRRCPYRGRLRGWPVRRMTGSESVSVADEGNRITLTAESWILDRIGHSVSGREAAALRLAFLN